MRIDQFSLNCGDTILFLFNFFYALNICKLVLHNNVLLRIKISKNEFRANIPDALLGPLLRTMKYREIA